MRRSARWVLVTGGAVAVMAAVGLGVGAASADNGDQPSCSALSNPGWDGTGVPPAPCPPPSQPAAGGGDDDTVSAVPDGDRVPLPPDQLASVPAMPEPQG